MEHNKESANSANDRIERYIYQVKRLLPRKNRDDIEQELRTLISDMLEERCGRNEPKQKDIDIVLIELGDPRELAAKYADMNRYLIGPALFPRYWMVLKLVLLCVVGGIAIASVVQAAVTPDGFFHLWANWFATTCSAVLGAFAFITVIFALIENRDKIQIGDSLHKGLEAMEKGFANADAGASFLDNLPTVPEKSAQIKRVDCIFGIAFSVFAMLLFAVAPQIMAVHLVQDGGRIAFLNPEVLRLYLPLFLIAIGLGLVRDIVKMLEGRYTKRLALVTVLCDVPAMLLTIFVFTRDNLFNTHFLQDVAAYKPQLVQDLSEVGFVFQNFGYFFLAVVAFAFVLDMITAVVKGIKYD